MPYTSLDSIHRAATGTVPPASWGDAVNDDVAFLAGSAGAAVATSETTASLSYVDLATVGPAVTVTTGTKAIVLVTAWASSTIAADGASISFAVSGASTIAAVNNGSGLVMGTSFSSATGVMVITGLTAGSNTFTAKYRAATGGTATFQNRNITVIPLP